MDISTIVNIILCVLSFILAAISVVTVVITLRQNNKMIEESTRPVISVYTDEIVRLFPRPSEEAAQSVRQS